MSIFQGFSTKQWAILIKSLRHPNGFHLDPSRLKGNQPFRRVLGPICPIYASTAASEYGPYVSPEEITQRLELLRVEHRDLDAAIIALGTGAVPDQLQLARLKKRKLRLRDEIAWCEDQLVPDIIA